MFKQITFTVFFIVCSLVAGAQTDNHPSYFITKQVINKVLNEAKTNPEISGYIRSISDDAEKVKIEDLKPFEYGWMQEQQIKVLTKRDRDLSVLNNNHVPDAYAKAAMILGQAYVYMDDAGFAEKGKKILLMLAEYQFKSDDVNSGLDWGIVNLDALKAYDLRYSAFTNKEHAMMQDFFERLVDGVMKCNDYWCGHEPGGPVNNHFGWHSNCFFTNGLFFDKPELINRAIYGSHGFDYALCYGFQEQWDFALQQNTPFIFITGWNEWVAGRWNSREDDPEHSWFCDAASPEYSRDTEPTLTAGLKDNYYMQMLGNIRRYKGIAANPKDSSPKTIKTFNDWNDMLLGYPDYTGDTKERNHPGAESKPPRTYTNTSGRNDFRTMKWPAIRQTCISLPKRLKILPKIQGATGCAYISTPTAMQRQDVLVTIFG